MTVVGNAGASYVLTRATDYDSSAEILTGNYTFIVAGSSNAATGWILVTPPVITLDTTALTFTQFSSATAYIAGAGLTLTSLTFAVGAGTGIIVNADDVAVDTTVVATTTNPLTMSNKTFVAPVLGAATATSINKVIITQPATTATLTIANNKTLTASNTLTFTGTDGSSVAFGAGGTVAYTANNLSVFAATTSAQLRGVLSDETGTGVAVFATSPTLVTPVLGVATATSINKVTITAPASNATLTIANGKTLTASNSLTFVGTDGDTVTFPSGGGTAAMIAATQTLTNKRITSRVVSMADATSFTPTGDTADENTQANTQSTGTLTANAPSGTPTDGQKLTLRIKTSNVQTFSWNAIYRGSLSVALPTASTGSGKTDYFGFIYNLADTKWDCVAASYGYT